MPIFNQLKVQHRKSIVFQGACQAQPLLDPENLLRMLNATLIYPQSEEQKQKSDNKVLTLTKFLHDAKKFQTFFELNLQCEESAPHLYDTVSALVYLIESLQSTHETLKRFVKALRSAEKNRTGDDELNADVSIDARAVF